VTNSIQYRAASKVRRVVGFGLLAALLGGAVAVPAYADDHDRRGHDDHRDRHRGYDNAPAVYYTAPPVVYAPPGASVNLSFPLFR
jgi:hypothetical protein